MGMDDVTFTYKEIMDVIRLIRDKEWPDWRFGDDQCNLWSDIRRMLGMTYD